MQTFSFEYQGSGEVNVQKLSIEGAEAGEFNLGGFYVDFGPAKRTGSNFVELTILGSDGKVRR